MMLINNEENIKSLKTSIAEKILIGLGMFSLCLFISASITTYLELHGFAQAQFISLIIVAPMVEEAVKLWAVYAQKNPYIVTGVFAGSEVYYVMLQYSALGFNIVRMIGIRIISVLMHMITLMIQKYFKDKFSTVQMSLLGYIIAVLIHAAFNFFMLLSNTKLIAWLSESF